MADHIQIGDISPRIQYTGDGSQIAFPYPFPVFAEKDLEIYIDETVQTLTTDYTVAGAGDSNGGTITFLSPPASATVVTLRRNMAIARTSDFQESGEFRAKVINDELDTLTALLQQVQEQSDRSLRTGPTDTSTLTELPAKADRLGKFFAFDANGDPIASPGAVDSLATSAYIATLLDDVDGIAARATLGMVIGSDVLAPTGDGSALTGIIMGASASEKSNISLNAFRIAVNGGMSVLNMVDGVADEFEDETGVDTGTSTDETYDATGDYYHNAGVETLIAQATGTIIGNMTGAGGIAAAFDSTNPQAPTASPQLAFSGGPGVGKDWGVGVTKTLTRVKTWAPSGGSASTNGYSYGGPQPNITIKVYGSNAGFQSSPVLLHTFASFLDDDTGVLAQDETVTTQTTAYRYHWAELETDGNTGEFASFAEIEFYENLADDNMVLVSEAQTALVEPDEAFVVLWHETVDAVTLDTDLKAWVSIDGGATWAQAALSLAANLSGNEQILTGTADVSGQTGTSVKWKIETLNNKEQRLRGVSLQWS